MVLAFLPLRAGKVVTDSLSSKILGTVVKYNVYLPSDYNSGNHYPAVYLLQQSMDLHMKMRAKKVHSELRVRNGVHNWEYWHLALRLSLPFASRNFD